jgi:PadR family transcriptional regulator AphA
VSSAADLSLSEWAVLGVVAEGRTHGFAVSRQLLHDGSVGMIWTIPRPLVYRAIASLTTLGLVREVGSAPGSSAPRRRMIEATPTGRAALASWLAEPVAHVRDARSELMTKLVLLDRAGLDPRELLEAQAAALEEILAGLHEQLTRTEGFERTLARWRLCSAEAAAAFVAELITECRSGAVGIPPDGAASLD